MDNTLIMQGRFTSDATPTFIPLRGGVDWIEVLNVTAATAGNHEYGFKFEWQAGMPQGRGFAWVNPTAGNTHYDQIGVGAGFFVQDTSVQTIGVNTGPITNITNATPPVITFNGHGLVTGDIIRLYSTTGALQIDGIDYHVTRIDANNFSLTSQVGIAAAAAPAPGYFRKISNTVHYLPDQRVIGNISRAAQAVVSFTAPHGFSIGQQFKVKVPTGYGMVELNDQVVTVVASTLLTVTIDVDSTGFTAFRYPVTGVFITPAQGVPVGEDTAYANFAGVNPLEDAVHNINQIGMLLQPGLISPAGQNGDVIYWKAGVSFSVDNN